MKMPMQMVKRPIELREHLYAAGYVWRIVHRFNVKHAATRTVSTQVNDWQSYFTPELDNELSFRLSTRHYALIALGHVWLVRDYHRRELYKSAGAIYDGPIRRWMLPHGTSLRPFSDRNPEWFTENVELFRRTIKVASIE